MKITRKQLKNLIKEAILKESQVKLGIPHGVDLNDNPDVLYHATMNFIRNNPDLRNEEARENAELLMRILNNTIRGSVQSYTPPSSMSLYWEDPDAYFASLDSMRDATTPEETESMREKQGQLKMAKRALGSLLGGRNETNHGFNAWRDSRKDFFRDNPNYIPGSKDWDSDEDY